MAGVAFDLGRPPFVTRRDHPLREPPTFSAVAKVERFARRQFRGLPDIRHDFPSGCFAQAPRPASANEAAMICKNPRRLNSSPATRKRRREIRDAGNPETPAFPPPHRDSANTPGPAHPAKAGANTFEIARAFFRIPCFSRWHTCSPSGVLFARDTPPPGSARARCWSAGRRLHAY